MTVWCFRQIYRLTRVAGIGVAAFVCAVMPLWAQSLSAPGFFDPHERFERPDLTVLPRLRFLTTVDFPPFNYITRNGDLAGYNIDLVRALCSELKVENICQIEALPWDELVPRLKNGSGEAVIAGLAPSVENRAVLAFTRAYMRFPARFISLRETQPGQPFLTWLRAQRVGVLGDTVHENMFSAYFPGVRTVIFHHDEKLYEALMARSIDLAFGDGLAFSLWLSGSQTGHCCRFIGEPYPGPGYLGEGMRIAVTQKNVPLAQAMDYALQSLERKGRMTELYLRYFPVGFYEQQTEKP